ncbi:MAG: hypothetical protein P1V51_11100 [Deltaproteobacteria bacterium]|nr:hypothetical protein [Deltaproteobacteria bacterium]
MSSSFLSTWNSAGGFSGASYLTDGMKSDDIAANVGSSVVEGIKGTAPASASGASYDLFKATYLELFGEEAGIFAENYYDAAMLIGLAMAKAKQNDGTALRDALREVASAPGTVNGVGEFQKGLDALAAGEAVNYEGASGPCDFDASDDVSGPVEIWQFAGGTTTQVRVVAP